MAENRVISRRQALRMGGAGLLLPFVKSFPGSLLQSGNVPVTFGVIADLHYGLEPTAMERLEAFILAAEERVTDCIIQLGDFNYGTSESQECMDIFNRFNGRRSHVLGNHDMDTADKEHMVEYWEMPGRYYSFDLNGFHFVVLDRNNLKTPEGYIPYKNANFYVDSVMRGHADPEQLDWLRSDLESTVLPAVVFVHQGLGMQEEVLPVDDARGAVEKVLREAGRSNRRPGVVACFCGHHHLDRYNLKDRIHYLWINSISYYWVGEQYGRMAPYRDPLFAFITFHPDGYIRVEGRETAWGSPSPLERGYPRADELTPYISDRLLDITGP